MRGSRILGVAMLAMIAAGCVPGREPPPPLPTPRPAPRPAPRPPQPAPAPPPPANWQDAEWSAGDWRYRGDGAQPAASFAGDRLTFTLRCERPGTILIGLSGVQAPGFVIRSTFGERRLAATPVHLNEMIATLPAADPLFDQLAFSRGRFLVQAGNAGLILPSWPEIARVAEDCRGA